MRKLASVQKIAEVRPIEGADAIEHYRVNGWWVVDKVGAHKPGDLVVYLEVDCWVPHELAAFLSKGNSPREYNGVKGERLRTVKLRGALSQGLILPVDKLPDGTSFITGWFHEDGIGTMVMVEDGDDVTEALNVQKWEPPIPTQLAGKMKGNFPSWARKTDQERAQNIWDQIETADRAGVRYEVTMKLDGSSMSVGLSPENEYTVCSRNLSLETDQEGNSFVDLARELGLEDKLRAMGRPLMISGELMGPGVQGNSEKLAEHKFFVFDIFDVRTGAYVTSKERLGLVETLGLQHAPVVADGVTLSDLDIKTLDDLLVYAEGPSMNAKQREGVVFKSLDGNFSFKAISNKWLLKTGK